LRKKGIHFISCPTCGRCEVNLIGVAEEVEQRLLGVTAPFTVAVMGCVVNGPGEAREADFGIAGGKGEGLLFRHGEIVRKVPEDQLADALVEEVLKAVKGEK
jgi:(E)-4-hydroxy-3-methylbut-2-enyl-diphosphate synthase